MDMKHQSEQPAGAVTVHLERGGPIALFLVQTRNHHELEEIRTLAEDLQVGCRVRILAEGPITAFVLKPLEESLRSNFSEILLALESVARFYSFGVVYPSFNTTLYRVIEDLCLETGSSLYPLEYCDLCGAPEPFPTKLAIIPAGGGQPVEGQYCSRCVAYRANQSYRDFVGALIQEDSRLQLSEHTQLAPRGWRRGQEIRFRLVAA